LSLTNNRYRARRQEWPQQDIHSLILSLFNSTKYLLIVIVSEDTKKLELNDLWLLGTQDKWGQNASAPGCPLLSSQTN
jgi:hypothetical protein